MFSLEYLTYGVYMINFFQNHVPILYFTLSTFATLWLFCHVLLFKHQNRERIIHRWYKGTFFEGEPHHETRVSALQLSEKWTVLFLILTSVDFIDMGLFNTPEMLYIKSIIHSHHIHIVVVNFMCNQSCPRPDWWQLGPLTTTKHPLRCFMRQGVSWSMTHRQTGTEWDFYCLLFPFAFCDNLVWAEQNAVGCMSWTAGSRPLNERLALKEPQTHFRVESWMRAAQSENGDGACEETLRCRWLTAPRSPSKTCYANKHVVDKVA